MIDGILSAGDKTGSLKCLWVRIQDADSDVMAGDYFCLLRGFSPRKGPKESCSRREFIFFKESDSTKLPVVAALTNYPSFPHAENRFGEQGGNLPDLFCRGMEQQAELGAEVANHDAICSLNCFRSRTDPQYSSQYLGKRNKAVENGRGVGIERFLSVCQFKDPVEDTDSERFVADRTETFGPAGFFRFEPDATGPVAVQVVLPFLGEKFDGAAEDISGVWSSGHHGGRRSHSRWRKDLPPCRVATVNDSPSWR